MSQSAYPTVPMVWRKSTHSMNNGSCVEAGLRSPHVAARDSKFPEGGMLVLDRSDWQGFLACLRS